LELVDKTNHRHQCGFCRHWIIAQNSVFTESGDETFPCFGCSIPRGRDFRGIEKRIGDFPKTDALCAYAGRAPEKQIWINLESCFPQCLQIGKEVVADPAWIPRCYHSE